MGFRRRVRSCVSLSPNQTAEELPGPGAHQGGPSHKLRSAASDQEVQTETLSGCKRYNNTRWITRIYSTIEEAEGAMNFLEAIYFNTLIPLQIVVLPNKAKW